MEIRKMAKETNPLKLAKESIKDSVELAKETVKDIVGKDDKE
jgi:hypothetical protein